MKLAAPLVILGLALVSGGAAWIYPPAGLITAGLVLLAAGGLVVNVED